MNLKGIHYSQQTKQAEGYTFNKGEDALPFVCDDFMLVADGLGGDGFFVHTQMNPDMWDREARRRLFSVPQQDEVLNEYFDGLFAEMDRESVDGKKPERYEKVPRNELHSGYFGSRIAAYCFVKALRHSEEYAPKSLFAALDAAGEDEAQRQTCLNQYADGLCKTLLGNIRELAQLGGFELESDRRAAKLLPTTLSAALYRETDDEVQVVCVWAGDSRVVAQLEEGCVQLTADDEKDDAMTNLIFLSDRFQCRLNTREYHFKKPFALFAVSDGTFDDMGGNMNFEALVVLNAMDCDSQEAMREGWNRLFAPPHSTDDSATVAYCFFGMEDMEASRRFVAPRIKEITEEYLQELPELFDMDCEIELQRLLRGAKTQLRPFQDEIRADPHVIESYIREEKDNPSPTFLKKKREIREKQRKLDAQMGEIHQRILAYYKAHWEDLRPRSGDQEVNRLARQLQNDLAEMAFRRQRYIDKLTSLKGEAQENLDKLSEQLDRGVRAAEKGIMSCSPEGIDEDKLSDICRNLRMILDDMRAFARVKGGDKKGLFNTTDWDKWSSEYNSISKQAQAHRRELVGAELIVLERAVKQVEQAEDPEVVDALPPEVRVKKEKRQELSAQKEALEKEIDEAAAGMAQKRAEGSMGSILDDLINSNGLLERLSRELQGKLMDILRPLWEKRAELEKKARLQKEIFTQNDKRYLRYIQGE